MVIYHSSSVDMHESLNIVAETFKSPTPILHKLRAVSFEYFYAPYVPYVPLCTFVLYTPVKTASATFLSLNKSSYQTRKNVFISL